MDLKFEKIVMYGLPIWVLLVLFALNFSFKLRDVNRMFALAAVVVVGITFILGPLGKFIKTANKYKIYRKYLGISAFILMIIHAAISFILYYNLDLMALLGFDNPRMLQVYSAVMAFLIFSLMAITSNQKAIKLLGASNWKLLQTSGYIAMALVILHFMLANTKATGFKIERIYALTAFIFGVIVVLVRLLVWALVFFEKTSRRR